MRRPAAVTWNSRNSADPNRTRVSPVPWMVTGLVMTSALGPAGCGTATVLVPGLLNVVRKTFPPATAVAKTIVSASSATFAWVMAARRLPAPLSARLVTVNVAGVVRSSSWSRRSRA